MLGVDRVGLLLVEPGRVGVDVDDVERGHHLTEAEHVAVLGDTPAQRRQVVQQTLGQEAAIAVQEQVGLRIALDSFGALAENRWQVGVFGDDLSHADPDQRLVQRELTRGRRHQILTAQHMGDLHHGVVDRIDQRVQRFAAGAGQREIRHRTGREGGLAPHQVVPGDVLVGHPQPQHRLASLRLECGALFVGQGRGRSCRTPVSLRPAARWRASDLLGGGVGCTRLEQARGDVAVDVTAQRLPVGLVRVADPDLVPVQTEPAQMRVEDRGVALLGVPRGVGVLDPEDEGAAVVCRA